MALRAQRLDDVVAPSRRARAREVAGRALVPGRDALQEPAALGDEHVTVVVHDAGELAGPQLVVDPTEKPLGGERVHHPMRTAQPPRPPRARFPAPAS